MSDRAPSESHQHDVSRRSFLKGVGTVVIASAAAPMAKVTNAAEKIGKFGGEKTFGPEAIPITLNVNGKPLKLTVEPRVTLLEALRNHSDLTGAKEVCDRATCGACTVLFDDEPVYSCMKLAIEAQGHAITTVEGLAKGGKLTDVQQAFVECDGLMCGYCTPGYVMSVTALLKKNPHPTADDVRTACSGNLCRCGAQPFVLKAALKAAGVKVTSKTEVIRNG